MAYQVTERALTAASQKSKTPNLVLQIEGVDEKYAVQVTQIIPTYDSGHFYDEPGLTYDGLVDDEDTKDYISLSGTSDTVNQQLEPDKGAASSTSTMQVKLVDINEEITQLITPGEVVDDVLYRNAQVFLGFQDTVYPDDYIELFNGKITQIKSEPGSVTFTISHPDELKRSDIFTKIETTLAQPVEYRSETIQDIFYQTRSDVSGVVDIAYVNNPGQGNVATISVVGNSITVTIDSGVTTAKTIKRAIDNDEDSNQLVIPTITGTASDTQVTQAQTFLNSDTEIYLSDVSGLLSEVDPIFRTYVLINQEIIRYTGIDTVNNKLTGITREELNSFATPHELNDEVFSFYKLGDNTFDNGNAIDLSLYTLLSGAPSPYVEDVEIESFVQVGPSLTVDNAIFFQGINVNTKYGVVAGSSTISVTGATNVANNITDRLITNVIIIAAGSYVVVDNPALVLEATTSAVCSFKTLYNILPDGAGLVPYQVDIEEFKKVKATFVSSIATYELYIKDTTQAKELIHKRMFLPSALYAIPRKGRVSVGFTAPSLYSENTQVLTMDEIKKPSGIDLDRGIQKNFYNAVLYKYNDDSVEDKFLSGKLRLSTDSTTRIPAPTKAFKIEADGIRPGTTADSLIDINSRRFLQRYQYGAESMPIEVTMEVGWTMEVGDSVIIDDPDLQISDTDSGSRQTGAKIYEITNKSYNWKNGQIRLQLTSTNFGIDVRYGTWSPSSKLDAGSTNVKLVLKDSFGTAFPKIEKDKWSDYIGREIRVHSADYSVSGFTYIDSFDPVNPYLMNVNPALGFTPASDYLVNIVNYNDVDVADEFYKTAHLFWDPTLEIVTGISATQFTVSAGDAAKLFVGSIVRVHNVDYSVDSGVEGKEVTDITGVTITVESLGFTPTAGQKINLVGFVSDFGEPYAWL